MWVEAPDGKIRKNGVTIAKNHLSETRIFMSDFDKCILVLGEAARNTST